MTLLYVLKADMKLGRALDTYETLTWRRPLWPVGRDADLECEIDAAQAIAAGVDLGTYLVVREDYQWGATELPVYRLDAPDWSTDDGGRVRLSARTLAKVVGERVILPADTAADFGTDAPHDAQESVAAETAIKHYWSDYAAWPDLTVEADQERGSDVSVYGRGQTLAEISEQAGRTTGVGWEVAYRVAEQDLILRTVHGATRSNVVLSLENSAASSIRRQPDELAPNVAYVLGKGEGASRPLAVVWLGATEPTGADRREIVVEASDLETSGELAARGRAELREGVAEDERITVQANPVGLLRYREHYERGDVVTVAHEPWGWSTARRIVDVAVTHSVEGVLPVAELGQPVPRADEPRSYE